MQAQGVLHMILPAHILAKAGTVIPVIDATYPLSEVHEAIRHLEEGRARGKVVITPWT